MSRTKLKHKAKPIKLPHGMMKPVAKQISDETTILAREMMEKSRRDATRDVLELLMTLPTIVILDSFGNLMPKKGRVEKFIELVEEQLRYIENGEVQLDELKEQIESEIGYKIAWKFE